MPWFDLFVQAATPGAMDRARALAAQQRAAMDEKRRRDALKAQASQRDGARGKNPDTSVARRPIGVRSGGPLVIYAGPTDLGFRVVSTGGTFKDFAEVDGLQVLQDTLYASGQDVIGVEDIGYDEWWYVGPGFPWRMRQVFTVRKYSATGGPFGEPCVLRVGDPVYYDGEPLYPITLDQWQGPAAGRIYYTDSGWVIVPYVLTFNSPEKVKLTDGDMAGGRPDLFKYLPLPAGDFTFEGWCQGKLVAGDYYYQVGWTHVAVCRRAGVFTCWVDGDSTVAPQMAGADGNEVVTLLGFTFSASNALGAINCSTSNTWDIGQVRLTLDRALYSEPRIEVPTARWV